MTKNKSRGVQLITIFTVIIMLLCIILLVWQFAKINTLNARKEALLTQKEYLDKRIFDYENLNNYYSNNREDYLEEYARQTLNWAQNNETWYKKG
ncbi:MAG: hypothetical protein IJW28_04905 [Clostridia bacterium]|nr:hypothetical protein [Clostridia bacterium]